MAEQEIDPLEPTSFDIGTAFESEMREFLKKIGCEAINGGSNFHIAPTGESNQIDACGRFRDILIIVECKAALRITKRNYRKEILAWKEKIRIVKSAYRNFTEYAECITVLPIFATKKIQVPEENKILLESGEEKSRYINETFLEYYDDLFDKIGTYSIFSILGEFGVPPRSDEKLEAIAIRTRLRAVDAFLFYAKPKDLLLFARVARREEKKEEFYQRSVEAARLTKISRFLSAGGIFPNNIIISLRDTRENPRHSFFFSTSISREIRNFPGDIQVGMLRFLNEYGCAWIVDGQHRLYSFAKADDDCYVPCIALVGIPYHRERSFFLEINKEQKKVPSDLVWDLEGESDPECVGDNGLISNVVRMLDDYPYRTTEVSPFSNKISIPVKGKDSGKIINMTAFCVAIKHSRIVDRITPNMIGMENPLFDENRKTMKNRLAGSLLRYLSLVDEKIQDVELKRFLLGNAGVPILLYVFEPILAKIGKIPQRSDLERYVVTIKKYFESNYNSPEKLKRLKISTTGEGPRKEEAKALGRFIRTEMRYDDFWPKLELDERTTQVIKIERAIGRMIAKKLSAINANWIIERVPNQITDKIQHRMRSRQAAQQFEENLGLGEEKDIILRKDNWEQTFKDYFTSAGTVQNERELELAFNRLSSIRNPIAHGRVVRLDPSDVQIAEAYLEKLLDLLDEYIEEEEEET